VSIEESSFGRVPIFINDPAPLTQARLLRTNEISLLVESQPPPVTVQIVRDGRVERINQADYVFERDGEIVG
jgi:hypothetical protein